MQTDEALLLPVAPTSPYNFMHNHNLLRRIESVSQLYKKHINDDNNYINLHDATSSREKDGSWSMRIVRIAHCMHAACTLHQRCIHVTHIDQMITYVLSIISFEFIIININNFQSYFNYLGQFLEFYIFYCIWYVHWHMHISHIWY